MISYRQIAALNLKHARWDGPPPLSIGPTMKTAQVLNAEDILLRQVPGGFTLYGPADRDAEPMMLEFEVFPDDPQVQMFTESASGLTDDELFLPPEEDEGPRCRGCAVISLDASHSGTTRDVVLADWQGAAHPKDPFARIAISMDGSEALDLTVVFPANAAHWTYVVLGPSLPDGLEIEGEAFEALASGERAGGHPTFRFRSVAARPARQNDPARFSLMATNGIRRPLISPLPTPSGPLRVIPETGAFETEIYVNLLSKGGP